MAVENRLKVILEEKKISQTELAKRIGVSKSTISNIISGRVLPSIDIAFNIASVLQTPVDRVFYRGADGSLVIAYYDAVDKMNVLREYYNSGFIKENTLIKACEDIYDNFLEKFNDIEFKDALIMCSAKKEEEYNFILEVLKNKLK